jgi:hypothetical protein
MRSSGSVSAHQRMPLVLGFDEKCRIQALDRRQPGLPLEQARGATMTHDYKRNGTTTLLAALDVLPAEVFGSNMQRHRHRALIRFLNALVQDIPLGNVILDSEAEEQMIPPIICPPNATYKHERCALGSTAIPAGRSTSPRRFVHG